MTKSTMGLVLVVGLLCGGAARADYMDWSYRWSVSPSPVLASGTGSVAMALARPGMGAHRILVGAVTTTSEAMGRSPDVYNKNFNLTLRVTDLATHKSANLTFAGNIKGTLTYNRSTLFESFRYPIEHLRLGNHVYWVTLPRYLHLMSPGSLVVPTFYASVFVQNVPPLPPPVIHPLVRTSSIVTASIATGPTTASTPEPSGLVLGSLGAVLLSCFVIRRIWG